MYLAIGITMMGEKDVLGLWLAQTEGAKFWLQVVRAAQPGRAGHFIAFVTGFKGFPDAIDTVFPKAVVQLCIVHMVRRSLNYVSWKRRKEVAVDLRCIYTAATAEEAGLMLSAFEARRGLLASPGAGTGAGLSCSLTTCLKSARLSTPPTRLSRST